MSELATLIGQLARDYGFPVALCALVIAAEGAVVWWLVKRNDALTARLFAALDQANKDEPKGPKPKGPADAAEKEDDDALRASVVALQSSVEATRQSLIDAIQKLAIETADDRELGRLTADLERMRNELSKERAALTALHERRFEDVRSLHAEQLKGLHTAAESMDRLSALLQGAMSGGRG